MRVYLIKALVACLSILPLAALHKLGTWVGLLLNAFANRNRHVARINISRCFPDLTPAQQQRLVRASLIETGKTLFEAIAMFTWPGDRILPLIKEVKGNETLEKAMQDSKGAILAAPHFGSWELVGLYCSYRYPMTSLYRKPKIEGLDELVRNARGRMGAKLVATGSSGIRALYQALNKHELIGILPDQDPAGDKHGVFTPFCGVSAKTMTLLNRLAHKSQAPVFFAYAERLPKGQGFRLNFELADPQIASEDAVESATYMNSAIEEFVRRNPSQYQWTYKRFRTRPQGEPEFYPESGD